MSSPPAADNMYPVFLRMSNPPIIITLLETRWDAIRKRDSMALTKYTFKLPVDESHPVSPTCFENCAKDYESGQLSYQEFLDAALAHIDSNSPIRHLEDCDLVNLANLSTCGSMGVVAAAIKLCMLLDDGQRGLSQEAIDTLRRLEPSVASTELHPITPLSELPPLHRQIIIVAALRRGLSTFAIEILSSNPPPPPPEKSLFNLLDGAVCPVGSPTIFQQFPIEFWTVAVKARWVAPSPSLARLAVVEGPRGGPLLRALLDTKGLDVTLITDGDRLYRHLLWHVAEKHEDPSLLKDILARVRCKRLNPQLLRLVVSKREQGGVEMLTMLLDRGLDINYRDKTRVTVADQFHWQFTPDWYEVSLTALHQAVLKGNRDAVSFLIARGASVTEPDYHGHTPRTSALRAGRHEIVQLIDEVEKR
ncbi:hypothetical protein ONZ43_g3636 [Nemania bipapillata]|uniref:Uncharacterized protein n=1 Tax=Nemania bipapillata TaxID=110536 RepID=A0ACC2IW09_9PEZI|nr:hypothetical protein ONZ43_g3636 [Nemania bipapillata]